MEYMRDLERRLKESRVDVRPEGLTEEQARYAMKQMALWLRTREQHQAEDLVGYRVFGHSVDEVKRVLNQVAADVDHSSLLHRLLRGRPLLPEPPILDNSYPVYPDWPYVD